MNFLWWKNKNKPEPEPEPVRQEGEFDSKHVKHDMRDFGTLLVNKEQVPSGGGRKVTFRFLDDGRKREMIFWTTSRDKETRGKIVPMRRTVERDYFIFEKNEPVTLLLDEKELITVAIMEDGKLGKVSKP